MRIEATVVYQRGKRNDITTTYKATFEGKASGALRRLEKTVSKLELAHAVTSIFLVITDQDEVTL